MTAAAPHPLVLNGRQAFQAGDVSGALSLCAMRLREVPDDGLALELKAFIQSSRGDIAGAEATLRQAIHYDPAAGWALNDLTQLLHGQGLTEAALASAQDAVIALPEDARAHLQLAELRDTGDDLPAAEFHARRALELAQPHPRILSVLGMVLFRQGRMDEALPHLLHAHRLSPDDAGLCGHIARAYETKRDMADAFVWLERAEAIAKRTGEDFTRLRASLFSHSDQLQQALDLLDHRLDARLERARLLDRHGQHDAAWRGFLAGRTLPARPSAAVATLTQVFTPELMASLWAADIRADAPTPIVIVGAPRSGVGLIEQMLGAHPDVSSGGALPFTAEWEGLSQYLLPAAPFPQRLAYTQLADYRHVADTLCDHWLNRARQWNLTGHAFVTDSGARNAALLPLIRLIFPHAPVIRIVRHPLDSLISILSREGVSGFDGQSYDGLSPDGVLARLAEAYALDAHFDTLLPGTPPLTIRYEDFIADARGHTLQILGQVGLGFNEACLRIHAHPRQTPAPVTGQITRPLNDRSIGRWIPYAARLAPYMAQALPLIKALGYEAPEL